MALPKPAGAWTYDDLFALPDDGKRHEIIEGTLFELPSVESVHALTVARLTTLLFPIVESTGGICLSAPLDAFLRAADVVQPNISAILQNGAAKLAKRGIEGPPDLIIEVITPSNRDHDELTKRALYGLAGVREYWIVDPEARTIELLALDRDALHTVTVASGRDPLISPLLGALDVTVESIYPAIESEH